MATNVAPFKRPVFGSDDESLIRQLTDKFFTAVRTRDLDTILSFYSEDAVVFDVRDALQCDKAGLRASWQECFEMSNRFELEAKDVDIRVEGNLAFAHTLSHATGMTRNNEPIDVWMRVTSCFSKQDGQWRVVHEHISVPGDFASGTLLTDLQPSSMN